MKAWGAKWARVSMARCQCTNVSMCAVGRSLGTQVGLHHFPRVAVIKDDSDSETRGPGQGGGARSDGEVYLGLDK